MLDDDGARDHTYVGPLLEPATRRAVMVIIVIAYVAVLLVQGGALLSVVGLAFADGLGWLRASACPLPVILLFVFSSVAVTFHMSRKARARLGIDGAWFERAGLHGGKFVPWSDVVDVKGDRRVELVTRDAVLEVRPTDPKSFVANARALLARYRAHAPLDTSVLDEKHERGYRDGAVRARAMEVALHPAAPSQARVKARVLSAISRRTKHSRSLRRKRRASHRAT